MQDPRIWNFVADMNYSGSVTISDIWLWFTWLFFYPGDYMLHGLINNGMSGLGHFLEISYDDYGGILSGILSLCLWGILANIVHGVLEALEKLKL